jgi:hypothetical protein
MNLPMNHDEPFFPYRLHALTHPQPTATHNTTCTRTGKWFTKVHWFIRRFISAGARHQQGNVRCLGAGMASGPHPRRRALLPVDRLDGVDGVDGVDESAISYERRRE